MSSRSWERMVERNQRKLNEKRTKQGKQPLAPSGELRFEGKSWILSLALIGFSAMLAVFYGPMYLEDGMFIATVIGYFLLGLFIYFFRKPFVIIGKNEITTRRFFGYKTVEARDIEEISAMPGYCVIHLKKSKKRWVFSKLVHRYNTETMAIKLKDFAEKHGIPYKIEF